MPDEERPAPTARTVFGRWWRAIPKEDRRVLGLLFVGMEMAAAALVGVLVHHDTASAAVVTTAIGIGLTLVAVLLARNAPPLPYTRLLPAPDPRVKPRQDRGWLQHKTLAFLLQAHMWLAALALTLVPFWGVDPRVHLWFTLVLITLLPLSMTHTLTYRLRRPEPDPAWRPLVIPVVFIVAAVVGFVAMVLAVVQTPFATTAPLLLGAAFATTLAYQLLHRPPTPREAWLDDAVLWPGRPALTLRHAVGTPAAMGLVLVSLVLAVALLVHAGGVLFTWPLVLLFVALVVLAAGAAALAARVQASDDEPRPWRERAPASATTIRLVLITGLVLTAIILVISLLIALGRGPWAPTRWIDGVALAVLAATGPYGFLVARRAKQVHLLEARFPDFLRDLASGREAGLTLEASIKMATRGDYGVLTPEIRRMSAQLEWNLPFEEALAEFAERVRTPLIARAVSLITEASRSGGHVAAVLQAAAEDARHRKDVQEARGSHMRVYTGIVYIGFLVFLGVAAVLYTTLVPRLVEVSAAFAGSDAPKVSGLTITEGVRLSDYRTFYFVAAVAQAIGNGLFAGLVSTGRFLAGLQHVFFMTAATALVFILLGT